LFHYVGSIPYNMIRVVTDLKCQLIASFLLAAETEGRVISAVVGISVSAVGFFLDSISLIWTASESKNCSVVDMES
jgi:hypothetical protein